MLINRIHGIALPMKNLICLFTLGVSMLQAVSSHITIIKVWRHGETDANHRNLLSGGGHDDARDGSLKLYSPE